MGNGGHWSALGVHSVDMGWTSGSHGVDIRWLSGGGLGAFGGVIFNDLGASRRAPKRMGAGRFSLIHDVKERSPAAPEGKEQI